jgi:tRNA G18 (ribose-2'-O)-methylase SpoU
MMTEEQNALLRSWQFNVQDRFKDKSKEEIKEALENTAYPAAVACEHWIGDFNMSTVLRNTNGFNLSEMFYIGKRPWNRKGSVGTHHYTELKHFYDVSAFYNYVAHKYVIIGIDNIEGSVDMSSFEWPRNSLMLFGEEGVGLTKEAIQICTSIVHISMHGSVRSFNAGVASGIAMYDYVNKYR